MLWFTSDLHLCHENILTFTQRPFATVDEMAHAIIANINECVGESDTLCILGDLSMKGRQDEVLDLLHGIRCQHVQFVRGNHDLDWDGTDFFERVDDYRDIKYNKTRVVASHYPFMTWNGIFRGVIHVHGHIHSTGSHYNELQRAKGYRRYDVGVDANDCRPVSIAQIREFFKGWECVTPAQDNENLGLEPREWVPGPNDKPGRK